MRKMNLQKQHLLVLWNYVKVKTDKKYVYWFLCTKASEKINLQNNNAKNKLAKISKQ